MIRRHIERRDKGICAGCGVQCRTRANRYPDLKAWLKLPEWQADHIVPVVEGGGLCGLDGYRTLCVPCHNRETTALAKRLAAKRRLLHALAKALGWTGLIDTGWSLRGIPPEGGEVEHVPQFSNEIDGAWRLVGDSGCTWTWTLTGPLLDEGKEWRCGLEIATGGSVSEAAHTAPLAICRAFLRGHEIDPGGHA